MLCLNKKRMRSISGRSVWRWCADISIVAQAGGPVIKLEFKLDSGSDATVLDIKYARPLGLNAGYIRQVGTVIKLRSASGHEIPAYLFPVRARIDDPYGGWAEWDAEFAFRDSVPPGENLAGLSGFFNFFDVKSRRQFVDLEPIPQGSGVYFDWDCKHPHFPKQSQIQRA